MRKNDQSKFHSSKTTLPKKVTLSSLEHLLNLQQQSRSMPHVSPFFVKLMMPSVFSMVLFGFFGMTFAGLLVGLAGGSYYYRDLRGLSWQAYIADAFRRYEPVDKEAYTRVNPNDIESLKDWLVLEKRAVAAVS